MNFSRILIFVATLAMGVANAQIPGSGTETIHSVAHVKPGHEAEYAKLSSQAWEIYTRLHLVLDSPHLVLKGADEKGRPFFVEVFTWKSAEIPDHAPPAVKAIWQQLENACEVRDGRPGIDFAAMTVLAVK